MVPGLLRREPRQGFLKAFIQDGGTLGLGECHSRRESDSLVLAIIMLD